MEKARPESPEQEESMKNFITTVALGLFVALAAGAAFAGEYGRHEGKEYDERAGQYDSTIYGTVRSLPGGMIGVWNVNGREVNVTKATLIKEKYGKAAVGAYVEVEGTLNGKVLKAHKVEVKRDGREERKILGTIETLAAGKDGKWIVNGEEILVSRDTVIKEKHGKAEVGAYVEVEGRRVGTTFSARKIEVKRGKR